MEEQAALDKTFQTLKAQLCKSGHWRRRLGGRCRARGDEGLGRERSGRRWEAGWNEHKTKD
jgi:hypothetical protein